MKHRFWTAVAVVCGLLLTTPMQAQRRMEFVFSDGLNLSSLVGLEGVSPRLGLFSEIGVGYNFSPHIGVELDVAFSEQGAWYVEGKSRYDYAYNYLNIPLLAKFTLPDQSLSFMAGVQAGAFLSGTYTYTGPSVVGGGMTSTEMEFDKSEFHPWDFGAVVGVRWMFLANLGVEVRYALGITQTHNGVSDSLNGRPYISIPDNRNSVLRLGLVVTL